MKTESILKSLITELELELGYSLSPIAIGICRKHLSKLHDFHNMNITELREIQGQIMQQLQFKILGDPSQGITFKHN